MSEQFANESQSVAFGSCCRQQYASRIVVPGINTRPPVTVQNGSRGQRLSCFRGREQLALRADGCRKIHDHHTCRTTRKSQRVGIGPHNAFSTTIGCHFRIASGMSTTANNHGKTTLTGNHFSVGTNPTRVTTIHQSTGRHPGSTRFVSCAFRKLHHSGNTVSTTTINPGHCRVIIDYKRCTGWIDCARFDKRHVLRKSHHTVGIHTH